MPSRTSTPYHACHQDVREVMKRRTVWPSAAEDKELDITEFSSCLTAR